VKLALLSFMLVACGGAQSAPTTPAVAPSSEASSSASPSPGEAVAIATPDIDLRGGAKSVALVGSRPVEMDGVAEGLAWPSLRAATNRKSGDRSPLTIAIGRDVPFGTVLRAVWTLRDADLHLQTPDAAGTMHVLPLHPKPETAGSAGCHLAVFVAKGGDLRVAYPGGPRAFAGASASADLARVLADARTHCAIRYVAFGAESSDLTWGPVFDVAEAVDREKSAGDARYVLGEPIHAGERSK
jgi:hypothetical protein